MSTQRVDITVGRDRVSHAEFMTAKATYHTHVLKHMVSTLWLP
jgi:hypothetical protein